MASNLLIGFLVGLGAGFWIFYKFQKSSGGNSKNSAVGAAIVGVVIMIAITIILEFVFKHVK